MRSQTQPMVFVALLTLGAFAVSYAIPTILEWWLFPSSPISTIVVIGDLWPSALLAWTGHRRKAVGIYAGLLAAKSLLAASHMDTALLKTILVFGSDLAPSIFVAVHMTHVTLLTLLDD